LAFGKAKIEFWATKLNSSLDKTGIRYNIETAIFNPKGGLTTMKKQTTNLIDLNILRRAACWCALVVGLTLVCGAAMAELIPITLKHDGYVSSVTFSPDGKLLATGTNFLVSMDIMASADNKRGDSQCP
jgi:WD40 repeat protein